MASQIMLVDNLLSKACIKSAKVGFFMNDNVRASVGTAVARSIGLGSTL
jgi:hypothetical protein